MIYSAKLKKRGMLIGSPELQDGEGRKKVMLMMFKEEKERDVPGCSRGN